MYQCVHYIKYTSIYKVHVPMCPLYKVHLYNYTKYMYQYAYVCDFMSGILILTDGSFVSIPKSPN